MALPRKLKLPLKVIIYRISGFVMTITLPTAYSPTPVTNPLADCYDSFMSATGTLLIGYEYWTCLVTTVSGAA
jgi:hypothetical protein